MFLVKLMLNVSLILPTVSIKTSTSSTCGFSFVYQLFFLCCLLDEQSHTKKPQRCKQRWKWNSFYDIDHSLLRRWMGKMLKHISLTAFTSLIHLQMVCSLKCSISTKAMLQKWSTLSLQINEGGVETKKNEHRRVNGWQHKSFSLTFQSTEIVASLFSKHCGCFEVLLGHILTSLVSSLTISKNVRLAAKLYGCSSRVSAKANVWRLFSLLLTNF